MLNDERINLTYYEAEVLSAYRECGGDYAEIARTLRLYPHTVVKILEGLREKFYADTDKGMFTKALVWGYID